MHMKVLNARILPFSKDPEERKWEQVVISSNQIYAFILYTHIIEAFNWSLELFYLPAFSGTAALAQNKYETKWYAHYAD